MIPPTLPRARSTGPLAMPTGRAGRRNDKSGAKATPTATGGGREAQAPPPHGERAYTDRHIYPGDLHIIHQQHTDPRKEREQWEP